MATFSLGAPGVYINERAGLAGAASPTSFSTVYMLVETEEAVPTTRFPFNSPIPVTSLADYRVLLGGIIPTARIPALSYACVNEFFQNAQVGDLRVVRVGTPNQIVEIEFFPSGTKLNSTSLPSALAAGDKVYVQMTINGIKLVAGDGSTGYTANGEWLGVPVIIPVNYVAGDEVNNRKISAAITAAVAAAIESNDSVRSSVYVRDSGLVNDLDPAGNSQNGYVTISATTFDGNVSVVTQVLPVGSNFVFMQNTYDIENIVGQQSELERVPQDYTQTIATAFDGQQDQGYLVTPTAYAQFDAAGRALVGAAAANHCASNSYKWMALADPGPFLVTDVNKYNEYVPHQAAADLVTGLKYLVDNAIYEWTGADVNYNKLTYQSIILGESAETAVNESANLVADNVQVGMLDDGKYTINASPTAVDGIFNLSTTQFWPVTLPIQEVTLSNAGVGNDFQSVSVQGQAGTFNLNGTNVYVIAPPSDSATDSEYSLNKVFLARSATDASNIYNAVVLAGGSVNITAPPNGAVYLAAPTGDTALLTYSDARWDLPVSINGQTSNLIENISGASAGVNTLHLPGTLQSATNTYRLNWVSRNILNPSAVVANYAGSVTAFAGSVNFNVLGHGLRSGQKIFFTQPIIATVGTTPSNLVSQTTKLVSNPYWVKVVDANNFVVANSLNNYTVGSFVAFPATGVVSTFPSIFYTQVLGGGLTTISPTELLTLPMVRARKYEFDSSSVFNSALDATVAPGGVGGTNPAVSIFLNNSSVILGEDQITPYGEDLTSLTKCGYLPDLNLVNPTATPVAVIGNAYCVPTVDQFFQPEAFFVPAINGIAGGSYNPTGVSTLGPIATLGAFTGGAGGTVGVYNNVAVTGGSGSGATVNVTIGNTAALGPVATLGTFTAGAGTLTNTATATFNTVYTGVATTGGGGTGATLNVTVTNVGTGGAINTIGLPTTVTPSTSGIAGSATGVVTGGGAGSGATVDVVFNAAGALTSVTLNAPGTGYLPTDVLTFVFDTNGAGSVPVSTIDLPLAVSTATLNAGGSGYTNASVLAVASALIGNVVGFTQNVTGVRGITNVALNNPGVGYTALDSLAIPATGGSAVGAVPVATIVTAPGLYSAVTAYPAAAGLSSGSGGADSQALISRLVGVYFSVTANGFAPDGTTAVVSGGFMAVTYDGTQYAWVAVAPLAAGGDLTSIGQPCYGSQIELVFTPEQTPPSSLWRFDAITSTEILDAALRGIGFNGVPQAVFIERGIDNVNALYNDSQRYSNPFGFIAYYGPWVENGSGVYIPPSPYVTGVAVRRYRAEGYQFPPAGVKYQLADAVSAQIPINSAQQNLLNPDGCNAIRTLPGQPQTAVFIWGGRTRVNTADAQQKLYQFVNTRVILNVVYGSLRSAFDSQIFNVVDGFGVVFNQIISVGNSVLNDLYVKGALFGARPSDAFQVICDRRINTANDLENGLVNAKIFVTPVPTLERIQIDLIRVAIGQMNNELDLQGLGQNNG
jgi:hypothetical protein